MVRSRKMRFLSLLLAVVVVCAALPALGQQYSTQGTPPAPAPMQSATVAPSQPVVILFIAPITGDTVPRLMSLVTAQASRGVTNITIAISSGGGDTGAAFGAYNGLKALQSQNPHLTITTVNIGSVASAAVLLFCGGKERYSLPNANFLIHGNGFDVPPGTRLEATTLKNSLDMLNSMNEQTIRIISDTTKKNKAEIEAAVGNQIILTPQQAKEWNLIQEIKTTFAPPNATVLAVSTQAPEEVKTPLQVTSITQTQ
jgi:ATP-dependent protease ClpP protease subunit